MKPIGSLFRTNHSMSWWSSLDGEDSIFVGQNSLLVYLGTVYNSYQVEVVVFLYAENMVILNANHFQRYSHFFGGWAT